MAPCLACCAPTLQQLILVTYGAQLLPVALWWCIVYPLQVPDPSDDLLAAAMLDQQPLDSAPAVIREIMEALPRAFPITVWHTINMARQGLGLTSNACCFASTTCFDACCTPERAHGSKRLCLSGASCFPLVHWQAPCQPAADTGATEGAIAGEGAPATAAHAEGTAAATAPVLAADESGVRLVSDVGTATPVEDFQTLLSSGQVEKAFTSMQVRLHCVPSKFWIARITAA